VDDVEAMARAIVRAIREPTSQPPQEWLRQYEVESVAERYLEVMLTR
jgi:hypothetical protein